MERTDDKGSRRSPYLAGGIAAVTASDGQLATGVEAHRPLVAGGEPDASRDVAGLQTENAAPGAAVDAIPVRADVPRIKRFILTAIVLLAAGHLLYAALEYGADFSAKGMLLRLDLTSEQSLGTWFSAGLLAAGALVTAAIATADLRERRGWIFLAALLGLLSLDEVASLHESTAFLFGDSLDRLPSFLRYGWMIPALAVLAAAIAWQWRYIRRWPVAVRRRLVFAAVLFFGGAAGLEMVESHIFTIEGASGYSFRFQLVSGVEETLEMIGSTIALLALLTYLTRIAPTWTILLDRRRVTEV